MTSYKRFMTNKMADVSSDTKELCQEQPQDQQTQFLMIDYEDQLAKEYEDARDELYKQVTSLATKLNLLWEVVRTMIVFFIPLITGIGLSFLSKSYLPGSLAVVASTIFNGLTIGLVFLNLVPLNDAVTNYLECGVYTPSFVNCKCKKCHNRNNCNEEQDDQQRDGMSEQPDNITDNTTATENNVGLRVRNIVKELSKFGDTSPESKISDGQKIDRC